MNLRFETSGRTERVWTAPDGTVCLLSTKADPPVYAIAMVRGGDGPRERSLGAEAARLTESRSASVIP